MAMTVDMLCEAVGIDTHPLGVYDAPDPDCFAPLVPLKRCIFDHYKDFQAGYSVVVDDMTRGCPGGGYWMIGKEGFPSRAAMVSFLVEKEGLQEHADHMESWLAAHPPRTATHGHIVLGPLREALQSYLRTVTFFVRPDQLGSLIIGAQYHDDGEHSDPVLAPFGSACGLLSTMFPDLSQARAIIGATDLAMRQHLPQDVLAFTVTVPMLDRLLRLDDGHSFLGKPWLRRLNQARQEQALHREEASLTRPR